MRLVIQSGATGQFLTSSFLDAQPEWVTLLRDACLVDDMESAFQLIEDHTEPANLPTVVDLDDPFYGAQKSGGMYGN